MTGTHARIAVSWVRPIRRRTFAALLAVAALLAFAPAASAATITWAGPQGGLWTTAANWSPATVPGPSDDVIIGSPAALNTVNITLSSSASIHSLTIEGTTSFFASGGTLGGGGTLAIGAGGLTNATGSPYEIDTATTTIAGPVTLSAVSNRGSTLTFGTGTTTLNGTTSVSGGSALRVGPASGTAAASLVNNGTLTLDRASIGHNPGASTDCGCTTLNNNGVINEMPTVVNFSGIDVNTFTNAGALTVHHDLQSTNITNVAGGSVSVLANAVLILNSNQGVLTLNGGTLSGFGQIQGNVNNVGGTVSPGDAGTPGKLTIQTDSGIGYAQGPGGTLHVRVLGTTLGTFDTLTIQFNSGVGSVALAGTVAVDSGSFSPLPGTDYTIATINQGIGTGTFSGTFPTLGGPSGFLYTQALTTANTQLVLRRSGSAPAPPTASITTPAANATYTQGQSVATSFACTDGAGGPGIATCLDQNGKPSGSALDTSSPGTKTLTVTATSKDGQSAAKSVTYKVVTGGSGGSGPPVLSGVHLKPVKFTAKAGSKLGLTLTKAAKVTVVVTQKVKGHVSNRKCSFTAKHGKACSKTRTKATLTFNGAAGTNSFSFHIGRLKPGVYQATITARDSTGATSKSVTIKFTIKKPAKKGHK